MSNFPTSLDSFTNPATTDKLNSPSHALQHGNSNDAIVAVETKLGVNSSAVATTIDYLLKNTSSIDPGHHHTNTSLDSIASSKVTGLPTFPSGTIVGTTDTQTLSAKTLTTPVIASFYQDAGLTKLMTTPNTASDTLAAIAATQTLTNKRMTMRVLSITSSATPTINTDNYDVVDITALAAAINTMSTNLSGTPVNKDLLEFEIKDDGTPRAITWGASFVAGGVALPTTTVTSKILTVLFQYSTANALNKWRCIGSLQEA